MSVSDTFQRAVSGDRRRLARAISMIEGRAPGILDALGELTARRAAGPGAPHVLGFTGPPGAGKSTFVDRMIALSRAAGQRVAVVAVDPSSPFSGGAILGDRVRMERHVGDPGVFIRSISSRGHLGGLSRATGQVVHLLDAAGFDRVLVETVGVGQSELAICEVADTAVVVLTPESGDTVQTMKAGLLEIADLFVVNKADRPGAQRLQRDLEQAVQLETGAWKAPVTCASALHAQGVDEVLDGALAHLAWCVGEGRAVWEARRARGRERTFLDLVADDARDAARAALAGPRAELRRALRAGEINPYVAASQWPGAEERT
jgi:LAO/AO transport system kinase